MPLDDAQLIAQSFQDARAFEVIFSRYYDRIYSYFAIRTNRDVAADLAADVFCTAFGARDRFDLSAHSAGPWLFGIANNLLNGHFRSYRRWSRALMSGATRVSHDEDHADAAVSRADSDRSAPELWEAIGALSASHREMLLLQAIGELTHAEIAQEMGIPLGTVKSALGRVKPRLAQVLSAAPEPQDVPLAASHVPEMGGGR